MNKKKTRKLNLSKATLRHLNPSQMDNAAGGITIITTITTTVATTVSFRGCGSRNGCETLDCPVHDPTRAEDGCKRGDATATCSPLA